jgi:uncharacterized membrane protein YccC
VKVFIIRILLGMMFGFLLLKFFYPRSGVWTYLATAALLVFFAYLFEAVRRGRPD